MCKARPQGEIFDFTDLLNRHQYRIKNKEENPDATVFLS
jgi:hypothetical protein